MSWNYLWVSQILNLLNTTFMQNWNIEHVGLPKFPLLDAFIKYAFMNVRIVQFINISIYIIILDGRSIFILFLFVFWLLRQVPPAIISWGKTLCRENLLKLSSIYLNFNVSQINHNKGLSKQFQKDEQTLQNVFHFCKVLNYNKEYDMNTVYFDYDVLFRL